MRLTIQRETSNDRQGKKLSEEITRGKQIQARRNQRQRQPQPDNMKRQQRRLDVLKVQRHGQYSSRYKSNSDAVKKATSKKCKDCDLLHEEGDCRAREKTCFNCNGVEHYSRACPNKRGGATKRVQQETINIGKCHQQEGGQPASSVRQRLIRQRQ